MRKLIEDNIRNAIKDLFNIDLEYIEIEIPLREEHGDYSSSHSLKLSSLLSISSMEIAIKIKEQLTKKGLFQLFHDIRIVQPGFINFFMKPSYYFEVLKNINTQNYLSPVDIGKGKKIQIEFVSANPTGPLHIAHGRGAVVGDVTARILEHLGFEVQKEYYINNTGKQIEKFANSINARYEQILGNDIVFPEDGYQGEYITELAKDLIKDSPIKDISEEQRIKFIIDFAIEKMIRDHQEVLSMFNVQHDNYFFENNLVDSGLVDDIIHIFEQKAFIEEKDGAIWFKSTDLGDDKDRVLIKSDKSLTYFLNDIAYHYDKYINRQYDLVIDVWGADHHNHISRMKNALQSLDIDPDRLEVILIQLVKLFSNDKEVLMSKRSGEFITLRELIEDVGSDVARYIYLTRSSNSPLIFDLDIAHTESMANPVYYVQYAYVRAHSILKQAQLKNIEINEIDQIDYCLLSTKNELKLLRLLSLLQDEIAIAGLKRAPHLLTNFSKKIAEAFHEFYHFQRVLGEESNIELARLSLVMGTKKSLNLLLDLMGIKKLEEM